MTIQYCSDLHLEFVSNRNYIKANPIIPTGEILLLAGDIVTLDKIGSHNSFFDYVSDNFRETYWIPGNHEFYHGDLKGRKGTFREKIKTNVTLLNNTVIESAEAKLIFTTFWSAIAPNVAWQIERGMNDFYQIANEGKRFDTMGYNQLHQDALVFLGSVFEQPSAKCSIVVSHHLPTFRNYPAEYLNSPLNQAFASHHDDLITKLNPGYWIFGHHHRNVSPFTIGKTLILTNQLGYVDNNEHREFDFSRMIEV